MTQTFEKKWLHKRSQRKSNNEVQEYSFLKMGLMWYVFLFQTVEYMDINMIFLVLVGPA